MFTSLFFSWRRDLSDHDRHRLEKYQVGRPGDPHLSPKYEYNHLTAPSTSAPASACTLQECADSSQITNAQSLWPSCICAQTRRAHPKSGRGQPNPHRLWAATMMIKCVGRRPAPAHAGLLQPPILQRLRAVQNARTPLAESQEKVSSSWQKGKATTDSTSVITHSASYGGSWICIATDGV